MKSVRIVAEDEARLTPFVGLVPGQPLDPEAVRRAVELIFATGRFEDVPVEVVRRDGRGGRRRGVPPGPGAAAWSRCGSRATTCSRPGRSRAWRACVPASRSGPRAWSAPAATWRWRSRAAAASRRSSSPRPGAWRVAQTPCSGSAPGPGSASASVRVECGDPQPRAPLQELARPRAGESLPEGEGGGGARGDAATARRERLLARERRARRDLRPRARADDRRVPGDARAQDAARAARRGARGAARPRRARHRARRRRLERQPGGGRRADREPAAQPGPSRRARAREPRAARQRRGRRLRRPGGRDRARRRSRAAGGRARAARGPAHAAGPSRSRTPRSPRTRACCGRGSRRSATSRRRSTSDVADGGGTLPVVFEARPGPRAVVREVRTVSPPLPVSADDRGPEELALREGQPYRVADVARSRDTLLSAWRRTGHLDVQVASEVMFSEAQRRGARQPGGGAGPAHGRRARRARRARPDPRRHRGARDGCCAPASPSRSSACSRASGGCRASGSSSGCRSPSSTPAARGGATWW